MSVRVVRHHVKPNNIALGLAAGTSVALCAVVATGYDLNPVEVVGAFAVAGTIGAISLHGSRPQRRQPYTLTPVQSPASGTVVRAPRAHTYVAHPAHKSDAA